MRADQGDVMMTHISKAPSIISHIMYSTQYNLPLKQVEGTIEDELKTFWKALICGGLLP